MPAPGRFRFPLARVLDVREVELSIAEQELAAASAKLQAAEAAHAAATALVRERILELSAARTTPTLDITACIAAEQALDLSVLQTRQKAALVRAAAVAREVALAAHREALKNVKALEQLREKARSQHAQARRAAETKTLDEVAARRARAATQPGGPGDN